MTFQSKKPQKLKARLPRGLEDRGPAAIAATRAMTDKIREVYERYGFEPVETPAMEYTDALGKFLPDQDRPNEGVFSFQDDDEQWISLRYDLTAPLARYVAERYGTEKFFLPYRSYRVGYVFRNEKPGPGRFRQFMQFDADTVGSASPAADAEMCMMAADAMDALGIPRGSYLVKVNNRKVLDGVLESVGLGGDENADKRLTVLRAIDKFDRLGARGVRLLLGEGRWDGGAEGKGDFTKGAGLELLAIEKLMVWLTFEDFFAKSETGEVGFGMPNPFYEPPSTWPQIQTSMRPGILKVNRSNRVRSRSKNWDRLGALMRVIYDESEMLVEGIAELEAIIDSVDAAGYGDRVLFDPSVVRGLEYYTGPVYEVELTLETKDENGRPVRFGSVGGGGRYDGLVSRFRGETVPATGFSVGVSRLQTALTTLGKFDKRQEFGPVVVTVFDRDRMADYQRMVSALRNAPLDPKKPNGPRIHAELYLGNPKNMGNQLKYADLRNAPCVVMQGSNEKNPGKGRKARVVIKDLIAGKEIAGLSERHEDYIAKQQEAQLTVLETKLVAKVREVLARHDVKWG